MLGHQGIQPSTFDGGLDDLGGFQAWAEDIKIYLSQSDPALYEVLEQTASSKQPIEEESMIKTSQDIMKDRHKALRVLQAKIARASLSEEESQQFPPLDEANPPEADQRTEHDFQLEFDRNQLQVKHDSRQLGYLLVHQTKGEAQLQVKRWVQSSNGWEAWRQLNLLYTTSKRSIHFKLLTSLMNPSFDNQPSSFSQQFNAWKEQLVRYQQLSREHVPDFIKLTAVVNGLKGNVRHFVLLHLDSDSSSGDLDSLLGKYFNNTYALSEASLNSVWDKAWRDKQKEKSKGKGKKPNPYSKQKLDKEGKRPLPSASKGKGKPAQLPTRKQWCSICWKKGHRTQTCWWNTDQQQQQQQHQQEIAWNNPSEQQQRTAQALEKRYPDQPVAYTRLASDNQLRSSLEHQIAASSFEQQPRVTTQSASTTPTYIIAQLDSFEHASSAAEAWGILVDTGASTSVAPKSFASDIELSPTPSALQLTTATGKAIKTYGLRKVHLQSRGLSLDVSFVIADVVTPSAWLRHHDQE